MKFVCAICGDETEDISPLGPEGVVICESCAPTASASRLLQCVRDSTHAAIALEVDPEKRIAIAKAAKAERDLDWFDAVATATGTCPRSRLDAINIIRSAIERASI